MLLIKLPFNPKILGAFTIFPLRAAWKFDWVLALETDQIFEEVWGV